MRLEGDVRGTRERAADPAAIALVVEALQQRLVGLLIGLERQQRRGELDVVVCRVSETRTHQLR
jgi:hypothetical protein